MARSRSGSICNTVAANSSPSRPCSTNTATAPAQALARADPRRSADPIADGTQLDGFVAGDDQGAKDTVMELVRSIGLNPVDVGPLARAQQLEQVAFLNIALNVTGNGSWTSGWKLVGAPTLAPIAA